MWSICKPSGHCALITCNRINLAMISKLEKTKCSQYQLCPIFLNEAIKHLCLTYTIIYNNEVVCSKRSWLWRAIIDGNSNTKSTRTKIEVDFLTNELVLCITISATFKWKWWFSTEDSLQICFTMMNQPISTCNWLIYVELSLWWRIRFLLHHISLWNFCYTSHYNYFLLSAVAETKLILMLSHFLKRKHSLSCS